MIEWVRALKSMACCNFGQQEVTRPRVAHEGRFSKAPNGARFESPGRVSLGSWHQKQSQSPNGARFQLHLIHRAIKGISPRWGFYGSVETVPQGQRRPGLSNPAPLGLIRRLRRRGIPFPVIGIATFNATTRQPRVAFCPAHAGSASNGLFFSTPLQTHNRIPSSYRRHRGSIIIIMLTGSEGVSTIERKAMIRIA